MTMRHSKQAGYSLMELLVTVAIVAVVTSIALPSYRNHVTRSHRGDAMTSLLRVASAQEKFYLQNNTYTTSLANLNITGTEYDYYTLTVPTGDVNAFTVTASVKSGGPQDGDKPCVQFSINSAGTRAAQDSGGADNTVACWR